MHEQNKFKIRYKFQFKVHKNYKFLIFAILYTVVLFGPHLIIPPLLAASFSKSNFLQLLEEADGLAIGKVTSVILKSKDQHSEVVTEYKFIIEECDPDTLNKRGEQIAFILPGGKSDTKVYHVEGVQRLPIDKKILVFLKEMETGLSLLSLGTSSYFNKVSVDNQEWYYPAMSNSENELGDISYLDIKKFAKERFQNDLVIPNKPIKRFQENEVDPEKEKRMMVSEGPIKGNNGEALSDRLSIGLYSKINHYLKSKLIYLFILMLIFLSYYLRYLFSKRKK